MTRTLAAAPAGSDLTPVPGDGGLPLLGHGLKYLRDPMELWKDRPRQANGNRPTVLPPAPSG